MANVIGPDVSFYQDSPTTSRQIDFNKMKESAGYVIIRAGQNLWVDSDFVYNWLKAQEAGLPRGSYWFYDSRADPEQQAELWYSQVSHDLGELPLFADLEEKYGGGFAGWRNWRKFIDRLKVLVNGRQEIGVYTGYYYWLENAPSKQTAPADLEYFHQYPLWIAQYGVTSPRVPVPWKANEWIFWQYTDKGDGPLYGAESLNIDLNYFNGDMTQFEARFKIGGTPPGGGENPNPWYKVNASALNVREGAGTNFKVLGTLKLNDVVEGLAQSSDGAWVQIKRYSDGFTGWASKAYLTLISAPSTPPPVGTWYKVVNASALNVREGAGTSFKVVGTLRQNEVVEGLAVSSDGGWVQIKRASDGLTGWASKTYLSLIPPPSTPPSTWYKVTATNLNVREGAGTNFKSIGIIKNNQVVEGLALSADGGWVRIKRPSDGLTGWSSKTYLVPTAAP